MKIELTYLKLPDFIYNLFYLKIKPCTYIYVWYSIVTIDLATVCNPKIMTSHRIVRVILLFSRFVEKTRIHTGLYTCMYNVLVLDSLYPTRKMK